MPKEVHFHYRENSYILVIDEHKGGDPKAPPVCHGVLWNGQLVTTRSQREFLRTFREDINTLNCFVQNRKVFDPAPLRTAAWCAERWWHLCAEDRARHPHYDFFKLRELDPLPPRPKYLNREEEEELREELGIGPERDIDEDFDRPLHLKERRAYRKGFFYAVKDYGFIKTHKPEEYWDKDEHFVKATFIRRNERMQAMEMTTADLVDKAFDDELDFHHRMIKWENNEGRNLIASEIARKAIVAARKKIIKEAGLEGKLMVDTAANWAKCLPGVMDDWKSANQ